MEFAPIGMHPTGRHTTTPDGAVTFAGAGSLHLELYMRGGLLSVTVRAEGVPNGSEARLGVSLDDGPAEAVVVGAQGEATARLRVDRAGVHVLRVRTDSPAHLRRILVLSGG